ncbi:TPA: 30S ribosomal protein S17 [Candidatus Uhrbacteria bacterium]|nr:MAG: 30S ribosomal protein S17 [Candidatus Uhrbacteria bacterium RIFCSPHIGHO2_02_FULL_54_11]HBL39429.1 30S ribosomal protein S17 [Candidatus Uhrbacteria bacterium]
MNPQKSSILSMRRRFTGTAVSDARNKTLVVQVERTVLHPKYGKRYVRNSRYHVHDEKNQYKAGDPVSFEESRPYSRTKRWRVLYGA